MIAARYEYFNAVRRAPAGHRWFTHSHWCRTGPDGVVLELACGHPAKLLEDLTIPVEGEEPECTPCRMHYRSLQVRLLQRRFQQHRWESRAAGAHMSPGHTAAPHTHWVALDAHGQPVLAWCKRLNMARLAPTGTQDKPTCPRCQQGWRYCRDRQREALQLLAEAAQLTGTYD